MSDLTQYYTPRRVGMGAVAGALARRYGPSIVSRYGSRARSYLSQNVSGLASRVKSALSRQAEARVLKRSARRGLRGGRSVAGVQVASGGGGESKSHTRLVKKAYNIPATQLLGMNSYNRTSPATATAAQGTQAVLALGNYFDATDILAMATAVGETSVVYNAAKYLLLGVHAENLITNATNLNTHCIIYDVIAKHDGFTTTNVSPTSVFTLGGADAGGGAANDYLIVGTTPWNNPRFLEMYSIIKQTPVILGPGQTHVHTVTYKPNMIFNKERYTVNGTGPIGGLTMYSFVVFHGTPVHDTSTEIAISTGLAKLDCVLKESTQFRKCLISHPTNSIQSSIPAVTAPEQWVDNNPTDAGNAI